MSSSSPAPSVRRPSGKSGSGDDETRLLMDEEGDGGEKLTISSSQSPQQTMSDFVFIKIIARLSLGVLKKFWAASSAAVLAVILLYWLLGGLPALLLVFFAVSGLLYNAGDRLLYHPDQPSSSRAFVPAPSVVGITAFESIFIRARDRTRVHLFLVKAVPPMNEAPTVLYLHGNAGNVGHRLLNVRGLYETLGSNVCMLEYRGYGHSDGAPSEEGLYMDAQAALDFLCSRSDVDSNKIILFGRSLGGGVAIEIASRPENRDKIACVVVENTFTSIPDVAKALFNFRVIRSLPEWCYKNQYKSRWKVCRISAPILFVSGLLDNLVPPKMMTDLFNSCGSEVKRLARFSNGTHNETWACQQYYPTLKYFVQEVAKVRLSPSCSPAVRVNSPPPQLLSDTFVI